MYREYRDLTAADAVTACCKILRHYGQYLVHIRYTLSKARFIMIFLLFVDRDMGARHRARASAIQIIKVEVVAANKCRRPNIKQFHVRELFTCD